MCVGDVRAHSIRFLYCFKLIVHAHVCKIVRTVHHNLRSVIAWGIAREGGLSTASTVPAPSEEARENARRGCEEARRLEELKQRLTDGSPKEIRVDGVPVVLATPPDRIRRRTTTLLSDPKLSDPAKAAEDTPTTTASSAPVPVHEGCAVVHRPKRAARKHHKRTKCRKIKNKKQKTAKATTADQEMAPAGELPGPAEEELWSNATWAYYPEQPWWNAWNWSSDWKDWEAPADQLSDQKGPSMQLDQTGHQKTSEEVHDGNHTKGEVGGDKAPKPSPKLAAKKSAAVPPRVKTEESAEHPGQDAPPTEKVVKRSQSDNLLRATSSIQQTPSTIRTPQENTEDDLPARDEEVDQEDDEEEYEEEPEEEEEHKEDDQESKKPAAPAAPVAPAAPDATAAGDETATAEPTKKEKKEKTPEEKKHHARYMRFYRSLRSTLSITVRVRACDKLNTGQGYIIKSIDRATFKL